APRVEPVRTCVARGAPFGPPQGVYGWYLRRRTERGQFWYGARPNKRLKLTGPAFKGGARLCANELVPQCGASARQPSPRSLSAVRRTAPFPPCTVHTSYVH